MKGGMFGASKPNGLGGALNALYPAPTLEDEIRRLIQTHGKQAVLEAVKQLTKAKRGRKPDPDWEYLVPIIKEDADLWLQGKDPTKRPRTNYAIATIIAKHNPGHSQTATVRRILRKLSEKRQLFRAIFAYEKSADGYPFNAHLRSLKELAKLSSHPVWRDILSNAEATLGRYRERHGEPNPQLTFAQVEEAARSPLNAFLSLPSAPGLLPSFRTD